MDRNVSPTDGALDKLNKVLPADITALFLAIRSIIEVIAQGEAAGAYVSALMIVVLTLAAPLLLHVFQSVAAWSQRLFTAGTFLIWAINIEYENIMSIIPGAWGMPAKFAIPITLLLWAGIGLPTYFFYTKK